MLNLRKFEELLAEEARLNLIGANGGPITFDGWVKVQFQLTSSTQSAAPIIGPPGSQEMSWNVQLLVVMQLRRWLKV